MSVQCVDTDLASNLAIIPGIQLKTFYSHQIPRSIIPSHLGENFQSTLLSQLSESSCMGFCSDQVATFKIFSQESDNCCIIGEKALHFSFQLSWINNIFQFINLSYGWLDKVYKDHFHLFSILEQQMGLISILTSLQYNVSPFSFSTFPGVNIIECCSWEEEKTKNCIQWLNYES